MDSGFRISSELSEVKMDGNKSEKPIESHDGGDVSPKDATPKCLVLAAELAMQLGLDNEELSPADKPVSKHRRLTKGGKFVTPYLPAQPDEEPDFAMDMGEVEKDDIYRPEWTVKTSHSALGNAQVAQEIALHSIPPLDRPQIYERDIVLLSSEMVHDTVAACMRAGVVAKRLVETESERTRLVRDNARLEKALAFFKKDRNKLDEKIALYEQEKVAHEKEVKAMREEMAAVKNDAEFFKSQLAEYEKVFALYQAKATTKSDV